MKILIADDSALIRHRAARLAAYQPGVTEVFEASSVPEALAVIEQDRPDAILLDFFLLNGTALDVLRQIRTPDYRPLIIVLSNIDTQDLRDRCYEAGTSHFLDKGTRILDAIKIIEAAAAQQLSRGGHGPAELTPSAESSCTSP